MSFSDGRETDLFGNPVRERKGQRGRPALEITAEQRDQVEMACVRGWGTERIANAVGIAPTSLKRHFRSELKQRDTARDRMRLALDAKLVRAGMDGNTGALKEARKMIEREERRAITEAMEASDKARQKTMGKKEQRAADAAAAQESDDLLRPGYGLN